MQPFIRHELAAARRRELIEAAEGSRRASAAERPAPVEQIRPKRRRRFWRGRAELAAR